MGERLSKKVAIFFAVGVAGYDFLPTFALVNRSGVAPAVITKNCCCSSVVEHFLGKEEVTSSILVNSSTPYGTAESETISSYLNGNAEIAQLVEHNLAKVGVASSSLVFRSSEGSLKRLPFLLFVSMLHRCRNPLCSHRIIGRIGRKHRKKSFLPEMFYRMFYTKTLKRSFAQHANNHEHQGSMS